MRFKLFAVGLLLSAAGSLVPVPAAAEWASGTLSLEGSKEGDVTGKTSYIWAKGIRGTFAVRFDYENIPLMKGRSFSGVGFLNCANNLPSQFYWNTYDLSDEDAVGIVNEYAELICGEYTRFYPESPALK